ncbi:MAG: hypothetical protein IPJ61_17680 [Tessaracoccus sp.]|uniref:hypothetical protein n=1 Tax=Tessaracoccus sp. TaxID=1971211 RepID=UPI001ECD008D|nr:hypothetical protein [Tessaracoccus sp.]MBK7822835.1 hypothetical protein [Tessaracoccus sp.]
MHDEPIWCQRGCYSREKHLPYCEHRDDHTPGCVNDQCYGCNPERCDGCQPREATVGVLCDNCGRRLDELLGDSDEGVAGVCTWLAETLVHPYRCNLGKSGRGNGENDGFERLHDALNDLQTAWAELAADFLSARDARPVGTNPDEIAQRLRPFARQLAEWEPIADTIDHLIELRANAHAVAPWRGRNPDEADEVAAVLYLAPAETTPDICAKFGIPEKQLHNARHRGLIQPERDHERPLSWRPWSIYAWLHPDAAQRYEQRVGELARQHAGIVHTTGAAS